MELRFTQRHVMALNVLLIVALAYFTALCVNDVISRVMAKGVPDRAPISSAPRVVTGVRSRAYYQAIVRRDVFNLTPQETGPAPVVVEDLHLKLLGTSIMSDTKPYAIVEDQSGNQSLYQVGEDIPDAGRLVAVETNRAIIDRGGKRVAIDIPSSDIPQAPPSRLGKGFPGLRSPAIGRMPPHIRRTPRAEENDSSDDSEDKDDSGDQSKLNLKRLGPGKFEVSRVEVQQTMKNPEQFFTQIRALPHFVNGKIDGFAVSEVAPASVFDQLGIQNGDTITSINGQPVTNPMQAMTLMNGVQTRQSVDLTLSRGGAPMRVHLDLR
jgi:general secretion pathway protein C